jgi:uncharacterized protein
MAGETSLDVLLNTMRPIHNEGDYVFVIADNKINIDEIVMCFKETEGTTIIIKKTVADKLHLSYSSVFAWITLTVHSSLEAVGLTAAFATALAKENISCNVVAAFYHDHIFVNKKDVEKVMKALANLATT